MISWHLVIFRHPTGTTKSSSVTVGMLLPGPFSGMTTTHNAEERGNDVGKHANILGIKHFTSLHFISLHFAQFTHFRRVSGHVSGRTVKWGEVNQGAGSMPWHKKEKNCTKLTDLLCSMVKNNCFPWNTNHTVVMLP